MEILCERTTSNNRYLELETDVGLKSRMLENCTYGSVRGSRQAFHVEFMKGVSRLSTRRFDMTTYNYKSNRKLHMDFLRMIAIFMVLFNHTGAKGFALFTIARESYLYGCYLFLSIFIKIAVPIFFMISGALLLGRGDGKRNISKLDTIKRFKKFLVILIICSFISYLYSLNFKIENFDIKYFFQTLYSSRVTGAYWYLYSYLAYILMLPLLCKLAQTLSNQQFIYMIKIYFIMQIISIVQYIIWKGQISYNSSFSLFIMEDNIFYPLLGYFIEERIPKKYYKKTVVKLVLISIIFIIISCYLTQYHCNLINEWNEASCQRFFSTLIFIPTFSVYFITKMWFETHKLSEYKSKVLILIGSSTFGIYLFEQIYRDRTQFIFNLLLPYLHTLPACLIWILSACVLGFIVTIILKQIPIIKKFI